MNRRIRTVLVTVLALAAVTIDATACSSSSSTADHSGEATPIIVGGTAPIASSVLSQPQFKDGLQAAIDAANAKGGINGHPVRLDFCDTKDTANGEFACLRRLTDEKVAAILCPALFVDQSGRGYAYAAKAGVPIVGTQGLSPIEANSKDIFPIGPGLAGWTYGAVAGLLKAGARKVAILDSNEPAAEFNGQLAAEALKSAGLTAVHLVTVDASTDPTFVAGAAKAASGGVDGVFYTASPTYSPKAVTALRSAGYQGPIASLSGLFPPEVMKALGGGAKGLLLASQVAVPTDTGNPAVARFLAELKRYQPHAETAEQTETAWAAYQLFAAVVGPLHRVDASSVRAAFTNLSGPVRLGIVGPYAVEGAPTYLAAYPNVYNPTVQLGIANSAGVLEPDGGFVNPFTTLTALAGK